MHDWRRYFCLVAKDPAWHSISLRGAASAIWLALTGPVTGYTCCCQCLSSRKPKQHPGRYPPIKALQRLSIFFVRDGGDGRDIDEPDGVTVIDGAKWARFRVIGLGCIWGAGNLLHSSQRCLKKERISYIMLGLWVTSISTFFQSQGRALVRHAVFSKVSRNANRTASLSDSRLSRTSKRMLAL